MNFNTKRGDFSRLGAIKGKTWANFCILCRKESDCDVLLYQRGLQQEPEKVPVPKEFSKGNLRAVRIDGCDLSEYDYNFQIDGKIVPDPYAVRITGRDAWADLSRSPKDVLRCRYEESRFSWKGESEVEIPRREMVLYKLHVRGFTMGLPESAADRGTFRGLTRKLSYLKSLGVTSIELMPVYEFEELIFPEFDELPEYVRWESDETDLIQKPDCKKECRINYWGYGGGMYFAPKAGFSASGLPATELKECILQMHRRGMECIMEIDFSPEIAKEYVLAVLRYWTCEFHVDGFHLQGDAIPMDLVLEDPCLGRTKFFYKGLCLSMIPKEEEAYPRAFLDTDEFLYPCRKLAGGLNGDIWDMADQMKKQDGRLGHINYITDHNGFTLKDLFSYEWKHNEANGEDNSDGLTWNYSCNCGVEGETTSRNVARLRDRRMKNAVAMLFFSQGVPMLMAGDEDCNTQKGNNNAYCQDNAIGWKDWSQARASKDFLKYVKKIIAFRKEHAILRMERPMRLMDFHSFGYPDLSYHEEEAWISHGSRNVRALGLLYCGQYAGEEEDVYIGLNFSDLHKNLALPRRQEDESWHLVMDTALKGAFLSEPEALSEGRYTLEAQSVCIIIGKKAEAAKEEEAAPARGRKQNESMAAFKDDSAS